MGQKDERDFMKNIEQDNIPPYIEGSEIRNVYVTSLMPGQVDQQFLDHVATLGYTVHPQMALGKLYMASIYQTRKVALPPFEMDPGIRMELLLGGYKLVETEATNVDRFFTGGQWGSNRGGIYIAHSYGPLLVCTRGNESLQQVLDAYYDVTQGTHPGFHLGLFIEAIRVGFGKNTNHTTSRIPVAVLEQNGTGKRLRYIPDSKVVIDEKGNHIPYTANDHKPRVTHRWTSS